MERTNLLLSVGQIGIPAREIARATRFYGDMLELPLLWAERSMACFCLLGEVPAAPEFEHAGSGLCFVAADLKGPFGIWKGGASLFPTPRTTLAIWGMCRSGWRVSRIANLLALKSEQP